MSTQKQWIVTGTLWQSWWSDTQWLNQTVWWGRVSTSVGSTRLQAMLYPAFGLFNFFFYFMREKCGLKWKASIFSTVFFFANYVDQLRDQLINWLFYFCFGSAILILNTLVFTPLQIFLKMCHRLGKSVPLSPLHVATAGQCLRHIRSDQIDSVWESYCSLRALSYVICCSLFTITEIVSSLKGEIVISVSLSGDPMKCGRWTWRRKTSGQDDIGVIVLLIVCRR